MLRRLVVLVFAAAGLPAAAQMSAPDSFKALQPAEGLQVRQFAAEPMLFNPTCIDVDARGRVWVCEGVNYRGAAGPNSPNRPFFPSPLRKSGDRIVILEDTDGDGIADKSTVFYEGLDLQAPLGIAVIGDKVWISQSPDISTIDILPDGRAGKKEIILTGFGGVNHDHGVHSVYLGPDGKLYGCFGNEGARGVAFPDGKKLSSDGKPFWGGCAWRANLDLTGLEILGHNFRNNYECATDSFGTTFMSDNDDDGNQWVRFTYVMEGGNFGYLGPNGAHWNSDHGSHWHMENPGVVPILIRTGAGSPTGLCIYEGTLLPEKYRGMPIHVDAGPGVVQCFPLEADGAGYRVKGAPVDAERRQTIETLSQIRNPDKRKADILLSSTDRWFRPSDVCVAPDGSLFVADWYDPGVGGHGMGDPWHGRIYRITPKGHAGYKVPKVNVKTPEGLIAALGSPCVAARTQAILRIREMGKEALPILAAHAHDGNRVLRSRTLQQLSTLGESGWKIVREALKDSDPDFRVLAIRCIRNVKGIGDDWEDAMLPMCHDPSPQVRRELLLELRQAGCAETMAQECDALVALANQYDGHDRFYLEAVGIAFRARAEEQLVPALIESWKGRWDAVTAGLFWELRPPGALAYVSKVLADESKDVGGRIEAVNTLGGFHEISAGEAVLHLAASGAPTPLRRRAFEILAQRVPGPWRRLTESPELWAAVRAGIADAELRPAAQIVGGILGTRPLLHWRLSPAYPALNDSGFDAEFPPEKAAQPETLTDWIDARVEANGVVNLAAQRPPGHDAVAYALALVDARGEVATRLQVGSDDGVKIWLNGKAVHSNHIHRSAAPRSDAVPVTFAPGLNRLLVKVDQGGGDWGFIVELEDMDGKLSERAAAAATANGIAAPEPIPADHLDPEHPPAEASIVALPGDAARGRAVFFGARSTCSKCHTLGGKGGKIGPDLSAIGVKAGKDALVHSILKPGDAIAPEFAQWLVLTEDGTKAGLLVEKTDARVVLTDAEGKTITIPRKDVQEMKQSPVSMMPEGLVGSLTLQELADVIQFLSEQK